VPGPGDVVSIAHAVVYETTAGSVEVVGIDAGGALRFATSQSTRLEVSTLMVLPGGRLEIGTPAAPVPASVTAEIVIKDAPAAVRRPFQLSRAREKRRLAPARTGPSTDHLRGPHDPCWLERSESTAPAPQARHRSSDHPVAEIE
jgi:hypothetical protein